MNKKEFKIFNRMNNFTLLYVEDDVLTQKIVKSVLQDYFKDIYIANDGLEGISLYKKKSPDIVLTDITMPKMGGLEMSEKIKEDNPNQHILFFTSYSEVDYFSKAINMKIDKYILKPLDTQQMFKTLDEVVDSLEKEKQEEAYQKDLEFASNHDLLTGLANRKLFFTSLKELVNLSRQEQKSVAILSMDLNRFKPINDTYGHDAGDLVLKVFSKYLQKSLRKSDVISRFGGDEFVIAVGFLKNNNHILRFLERLERNCLEPVVYIDDDGVKHNIKISFSMGITFVASTPSFSFDTLLRQADKAMYRAKEAHVPYAFFDPDEESKIKLKARKSQELKKAIDRGEFTLLYQPILNIKSNKIVAYEALLRWNHPKKGLLTPEKFLPYIWDNLEIGSYLATWVIETAFTQYVEWKHRGEEIRLCLNLSPTEFSSKGFISNIDRLLEKYSEVKPENISFEIKEETAIRDISLENSIITLLKKLGFKITLDDFGTGASTLSFLKELNVDTIKIDKSFVIEMFQDREKHSVVDASIKLAQAFGYNVVAMGIEKKECIPDLLKLGCHEVQGYAIARPMPANKIRLVKKKD